MIYLLNKNLPKILLFLAISPGSRYSRKEIQEKTEINNAPLDNSLSELLTFRLISKEKKFYSLNLDNTITRQIIEETKPIKNLPLKIQFILIELIQNISRIKGIKKAILFGSYAKLIYSEKSDIDIAIILEEDEDIKKKQISAISEKISRKYKKTIEEHFFTEEDLKHKEDSLIREILKNGKILV